MKVHFPIFQSKFYQWTRLWARDKSCQWIKISLGNIYEDTDGHFMGHYWFLGGPWSSKQEQIEDLLNVDLSASRPNAGIFVPTRPAPTHPLMANLCWTPPEKDLITFSMSKRVRENQKNPTSSMDFFSRRLLPLPIAPDPKAMARMTIWPVWRLSSKVHFKQISEVLWEKSFRKVFKCSVENGVLPTSSRVRAYPDPSRFMLVLLANLVYI